MTRYSYIPPKHYKRKSTISLKTKLFTGLVFLLVAGFFYLFFLSSVFEVRKIEILGNQKITESILRQEIDDYLNRRFLFFWRPRNMILANPKTISQKLQDNYLIIDSTRLEKKYFHKIEVLIKEREIFSIYCVMPSDKTSVDLIQVTDLPTTDKCYYIDDKGVIFNEAPQSIGSLILVIKEARARDIRLGSRVLNEEIMGLMRNIQESFADENLRIVEFIIEGQPLSELIIIVSEGWKIIMDLNQNMNKQIEIFKKILEEKIGAPERSALEYIDLRVPDRIYYKPR